MHWTPNGLRDRRRQLKWMIAEFFFGSGKPSQQFKKTLEEADVSLSKPSNKRHLTHESCGGVTLNTNSRTGRPDQTLGFQPENV